MKKREVLPLIHDLVGSLVDLAKDAATLEYHDNEQAIRRMKRDFMKIRETKFKNLENQIISIRDEIINNKYKKRKHVTDQEKLERSVAAERKPMETSNDGGEWLQDERE